MRSLENILYFSERINKNELEDLYWGKEKLFRFFLIFFEWQAQFLENNYEFIY